MLPEAVPLRLPGGKERLLLVCPLFVDKKFGRE
jgi:hypothetical protein